MASTTSTPKPRTAARWSMRRLLLGGVTIGVLSGLLLAVFETPLVTNIIVLMARTGIIQPTTQGSTISLDYSQMLELSDVVATGEVTAISATSWNQDTGEFWLDTLPDSKSLVSVPLQIHVIDVAIDQYLLDKVNSRDQINLQLTVIGLSPNESVGDYSLNVGAKILVFAHRTEIAWRNNQRRSVLTFMNSPELSILTQQEDGSYVGNRLQNLGNGEFQVQPLSLTRDTVLEDIRSSPTLREFVVK